MNIDAADRNDGRHIDKDSSPFSHEKERLFFHVSHRGINYLRNDFRAINRGALCARKKRFISTPMCRHWRENYRRDEWLYEANGHASINRTAR